MDMDACRVEVPRKAWELPFLAEAAELAGLRRVMRLHLKCWGLSSLVDAAQLCVTELVANVIRHVGTDTPTTLAVSMNGTHLRIEVHDPDTRPLPTLISAQVDDESGRGMALVEATADRWGVILRADSKVTWCELSTGLTSPNGHVSSPAIARAEALLGLYGAARLSRSGTTRLNLTFAEEAAIDVMADLLQWLQAHGCDPDEALGQAQLHADAGEASVNEARGAVP
ncbi:ATP-binding protein [Streptomyces sp. NPDC002889]|uniref:ATP-binding protein n=1 Tax=Streptomyces sp. NPDC002889 TaxID=3364669 RepID=UPI00368E70A9